jgi:hypothetical protein
MKSDLELKSALDFAYDHAFGTDAADAATAVAYDAAEITRRKAYKIAFAEFKAAYRAEFHAAVAAWEERLAENAQAMKTKETK